MSKIQEKQGRRHIYIPQGIWDSAPWKIGDSVSQRLDGEGRLRLEADPDGYKIQSDRTVSLNKTLADAVGLDPGEEGEWDVDIIDGDVQFYLRV